MINGGYQIIDFAGLKITKNEGVITDVINGETPASVIFSRCQNGKPIYITGIEFYAQLGVASIMGITENQTIPASVAGNPDIGFTIVTTFHLGGVTKFVVMITVQENSYSVQVTMNTVS